MIGIGIGIPGTRRASGLEIESLQNRIFWMLPSRDARRCEFTGFTFAPPIPDDEVNVLLCEQQQSADAFSMISDYPPGGNIAIFGSGLGEGTSPIYRVGAGGMGLDAIELRTNDEVMRDISWAASEGDKQKIRPFHNGLGGGLSFALKRTASGAIYQEFFGTGGNATLQVGVSLGVNGVRNTAELLITRGVSGTYAYNTIVDTLPDNLVPVGQWAVITLALQQTAPRIRLWVDDTLVISAAPVSAFDTGNSSLEITLNQQRLFAGLIGEMVGFGAGNSDDDLQRLRNYMIRRWGAI